MISKTISAMRTWISSWFTVKNRESVLVVLEHVSAFVDYALPIVEAIDRELKPALNWAHQPPGMLIEDFIRKYADSESYEAAGKLAVHIAHMPKADLFINVALFLLERAKPDAVGASILRLAIELAYNVYKGSQSATKVS